MNTQLMLVNNEWVTHGIFSCSYKPSLGNLVYVACAALRSLCARVGGLLCLRVTLTLRTRDGAFHRPPERCLLALHGFRLVLLFRRRRRKRDLLRLLQPLSSSWESPASIQRGFGVDLSVRTSAASPAGGEEDNYREHRDLRRSWTGGVRLPSRARLREW